MPINRNGVTPLNEQIAADLRSRIARGEFAVGERLPSLKALATEYGAAELTVHTAVKDLQRDGLIVSATGRGTYVHKQPDADDDFGVVAGAPGSVDELKHLRSDLDELRGRVEALERRPESQPS